MSEPLIVPINVKGLAVNRSTGPFVGPSADFSGFPAMVEDRLHGDAIYLADGIGRYESVTAPLGVRLHWTLPAALRHGSGGDGTNPIVHPKAPNRWLVTRIMTRDGADDPRIKSWVLESDHLDIVPVIDSPTMPFPDRSAKPTLFRYIGRWTDYDKWIENTKQATTFEGVTGLPLTAVGYGEPLFSAYAPNCANVFAFNDDFSRTLLQEDGGATTADPDPLARNYTLTYLVVGWYAGADGDPVKQTAAKGSPLKWLFTGTAPSRTILSGALYGLSWSPTGDLAPLPASPDAAVGATAAEAMSALLADDPALKDLGDAEFALSAIQAGVYGRLHNQTDWISKLDSELHRRGFRPDGGGWQWSVVDERAHDTKIEDAAREADEVVLAKPLAHALSRLNAAQQTYDNAAFEIHTLRQNLFFDWYRRQRLAGERTGDRPPWRKLAPRLGIGAMDVLIETELTRLQRKVDAAGLIAHQRQDDGHDVVADAVRGEPDATLAAHVRTAYGAVRKDLAGSLRLRRTPAAQFWKPVDPVLLLRGPAATPALRDGAPADLTVDGWLPCRRTSTILNPAPASGARLTMKQLFKRNFTRLDAEVKAAADSLLVEALFLDGRFDALAGKDGPGLFSEAQRTAALALSTTEAPGSTAAVRGMPAPGLARTDGTKNDWSPLLLRWTLRVGRAITTGSDGDPVDLAPDVLSASHGPTPDEVDLELPAAAREIDAVEYSGWAPLSSRATVDLAAALKAASSGASDSELAELSAAFKQAPIMAQAMGGLHEAMTMRDQTLQLNIADPLEPSLPLAQAVSTAAGPITGVAPDWSRPYGALRSGFTTLTDAAVVDVFGRVCPVDVSKQAWGSAFKRTADKAVVLPPRFAQAARLQFRWLAAGSGDIESTNHPATTPICGWIVPDIFDDALVAFDADGLCLGSLKAAADGQPIWRPGVPASGPVEAEAADVAAQVTAMAQDIRDPDLLGFFQALHKDTTGYLAAMLQTIDTATAKILPVDPGAVAPMLTGRPLVLARTRLAFELKGGPARDHGWLALQAAADAAAGADWDGKRQDRGLGKVRVPVKLGDFKQASDGLVGFFNLNEGGYGLFRSPACDKAGPGIAPAERLPLANDDASVTLALLLDPRAVVHAVTGVLPVKTVSLPAELYTVAMKRLAVSFYAGPLLFPALSHPIPAPAMPGWTWHWRRPQAGMWTDVTADPPPTDRAQNAYGLQHLEEGWLVMTPRL